MEWEGRSLHWGASELRPRAQAAGWQQIAGAGGRWGESRGQGIPFWAEGSRQDSPGGGVRLHWVWKGGPGAGGQRARDRGERIGLGRKQGQVFSPSQPVIRTLAFYLKNHKEAI